MNRTRKWLTALGAVSLLAVGVAVAQVPATFNLAGSEIFRAGLPGGGSDIAVPTYVLRSGENHTLAATGTTVTTQVPATSGIVLATGTITTWNINLPTAPYTGQRVSIGCPGGDVTTLSITATLPASVAIVGTNPSSCTASTATTSGWTYSTSANKWYRYR